MYDATFQKPKIYTNKFMKLCHKAIKYRCHNLMFKLWITT